MNFVLTIGGGGKRGQNWVPLAKLDGEKQITEEKRENGGLEFDGQG
jgi:hypothetical protein